MSNTNSGKKQYDNIKIPESLSQTISESQNRAWHKRTIIPNIKLVFSALAACLLIFVFSNIGSVYTFAIDIPIIGTVVRILHVGSGGERTDGIKLGAKISEHSVKINFELREEPTEYAPVYKVEEKFAPHRMVFHIYGVRNMNFAEIRESLLSSSAVTDVYRNMMLDDSAVSFTVVLKPNAEFIVTEYKSPGYIDIAFSQKKMVRDDEIWFIRSEAMEFGEKLGQMSEMYHSEPSSMVKNSHGNFIFVIGQYASETKAKENLHRLEQTYGNKGLLFIDNCPANKTPAK